jgi:hypothetical protein
MMRPLITTTTPSNNASILDAEEQTRLEQDKQQRSEGLVWKNAFLLGSVFGFVLQGLVFATYYSILNIWGSSQKVGRGYRYTYWFQFDFLDGTHAVACVTLLLGWVLCGILLVLVRCRCSHGHGRSLDAHVDYGRV